MPADCLAMELVLQTAQEALPLSSGGPRLGVRYVPSSGHCGQCNRRHTHNHPSCPHFHPRSFSSASSLRRSTLCSRVDILRREDLPDYPLIQDHTLLFVSCKEYKPDRLCPNVSILKTNCLERGPELPWWNTELDRGLDIPLVGRLRGLPRRGTI